MNDELFMRRALQLAELGKGNVAPNPMVGCVIVHEGKIIGEGYHEQFGGPHAEVNAINSVKEKELLAEATAYVTLEPCSHFGKTPPCADLLISHKVKKVVICNEDPNPVVSGKGIERLKAAGIVVEVDLQKTMGLELNRRFFTFHEWKRPYVVLKWAETADGFIARENFDSKWISNQYSRQLVHKWRSEESAVLIGTMTAKYDNASLTTRDWYGKNPIRLVIDRKLSLDPNLNLFDSGVRTICFSQQPSDGRKCEVVTLSELNTNSIMSHLYAQGVQSLIVEGGSKLINSFISENTWDEARVFISNTKFASGISAPKIEVIPSKEEAVFEDKLLYYRNKR